MKGQRAGLPRLTDGDVIHVWVSIQGGVFPSRPRGYSGGWSLNSWCTSTSSCCRCASHSASFAKSLPHEMTDAPRRENAYMTPTFRRLRWRQEVGCVALIDRDTNHNQHGATSVASTAVWSMLPHGALWAQSSPMGQAHQVDCRTEAISSKNDAHKHRSGHRPF